MYMYIYILLQVLMDLLGHLDPEEKLDSLAGLVRGVRLVFQVVQDRGVRQALLDLQGPVDHLDQLVHQAHQVQGVKEENQDHQAHQVSNGLAFL